MIELEGVVLFPLLETTSWSLSSVLVDHLLYDDFIIKRSLVEEEQAL